MTDKTLPGFIIGAYASLPALGERSENPEIATYYDMLADQDWIAGLEVPYRQSFADPCDPRSTDPAHQAKLLSAWKDSVITPIPGVMGNLSKNPDFGLASAHEEGRAQALEYLRQCLRQAQELEEHAGQRLFRAVSLHSAPRGRARLAAFEMSLAEIRSWDWNHFEVQIEHCDAWLGPLTDTEAGRDYQPEKYTEKGFLSLECEVAVAQDYDLALVINWGRSYVETQDVAGPLHHLRTSIKSGLTTHLMFSGCAPTQTLYGPAYLDGHLPAAAHEAASALDEAQIDACLAAWRENPAESRAYLGAKICVPPQLPLADRVEWLRYFYTRATA